MADRRGKSPALGGGAGRQTKVVYAQLRKSYAADGDPNFLLFPEPGGGGEGGDLRRLAVAVLNLDPPYVGAVIFFRLTLLDEYPDKPPSVECLTPNGVFALGGKICISVGEFHAKTLPGETGAYGWRKGLGLTGFARQLVNGLLCPGALGSGIRILQTPEKERAELAVASEKYNERKLPGYIAALNEIIAANPGHPAGRLRAKWAASAALGSLKAADLAAAPGARWEEAAYDDSVDAGALAAAARVPGGPEALRAYLAERHPTLRARLGQAAVLFGAKAAPAAPS